MKGNFEDSNHALATGIVMGALMKGSEEQEMFDIVVSPVMDGGGDYMPEIQVSVNGRHFLLKLETVGGCPDS